MNEMFESFRSNSRNDYKDALCRLEKENTYYNLTIALIKKDAVYPFIAADDDLSWENDTPNAINELNNIPDFSPVYHSLSGDFINFIAISQPILDNQNKYKETVIKICENDDEYEFLMGLRDLGYYAVDIYVEDLLTKDRLLRFRGIRLIDDRSIRLEGHPENMMQDLCDVKLNEYLKKYEREVNYSDCFYNKE